MQRILKKEKTVKVKENLLRIGFIRVHYKSTKWAC